MTLFKPLEEIEEDNINVICFDFKLQKVKGLEDKVSGTEYGQHLVQFLQECFQIKLESRFSASFHDEKFGRRELTRSSH